jgi:maleate isomerase
MAEIELPKERHIGLIVPSSNTVVESDFARSLPTGVTLHSARVYLAETTEAAERAMVAQHLPRALEDVASLNPDVVVFACTSAGAVLGAAGEARLMEELTRVTNAPVVSTNNAVKSCIARCAPKRVAVITPYIDELNRRIRDGFEGQGLNVVHLAGMGLTNNYTIAMVPPARIVAFAAEQLAGLEFDLLFVSCTNLRGVAARSALEKHFGVSVVTSNQATIEATLAALSDTPPVLNQSPTRRSAMSSTTSAV